MCHQPPPAADFPARAYLKQLRFIEHLKEAKKRIAEWPESEARNAALLVLTDEEEAILPGVTYALARLAEAQQAADADRGNATPPESEGN